MAQSPQPPAVGSPGTSPFRNIKPKTRKERAALGDKVALEHDRLMKRTGLAAKIYRENAPETSDGLVVPLLTAAGFMADADRFHTDTAGEAKRKPRHQQKVWLKALEAEASTRSERSCWNRTRTLCGRTDRAKRVLCTTADRAEGRPRWCWALLA